MTLQRPRQYEYLLKYVIVGDSSVGKSCLLLRFSDDNFSENYMATMGVDFRFKTLKLQSRTVKLQIWDTAGQERFRTVTSTYYKNSHAIVLVYDITSKESFENISSYWVNQVESYADPGTTKILVGNKSDLRAQQTVKSQTARQFASKNNMMFFETSAKTAEHVQECFQTLTATIVREQQQKDNSRKQNALNNIDLNQKLTGNTNQPRNYCC